MILNVYVVGIKSRHDSFSCMISGIILKEQNILKVGVALNKQRDEIVNYFNVLMLVHIAFEFNDKTFFL